MTSQISDTFLYKRKEFDLIGHEGGELFSPKEIGMEPEMITTACWRGYFATYAIIRSKLVLQELTIHERNGNYPPIGGVQPEKDEYEAIYRSLNLSVTFTGKLRLARNFIEEFYIHMGFQKPSAYKTVLDFAIENGKVVDMKDRSAELEAMRGDFKRRYGDNPLFLIDEAFNLGMDLA